MQIINRINTIIALLSTLFFFFLNLFKCILLILNFMYNKYILINNINGEIMIKNIMSKKIIFSNIDSSIKDVSNLMKENNIGFIPIKNDDKFVGVITDRDICLSIPTLNSINDSIKSYVSSSIVSVQVNDSIEEALKLMSKNKVKRLLVKDKDNTVGVLSLSDILNYTNNSNLIETCKSIFYIHNNNKVIAAEIDEFYL